eukprot:4518195-Pyramimonas_sp.AAC.1
MPVPSGKCGAGELADGLIVYLAAAHADVLRLGEGAADIHLAVGGGDHLHLGHLRKQNSASRVDSELAEIFNTRAK